MTDLVLKRGTESATAVFGIIGSFKSALHNAVNRKLATKELIFIAITLSFLQILDGLLTGIGVYMFGPEIEANMMIRRLITSIGIVPALVLVKTFALVVIAALCSMVHRVPWLGTALKCIIVLYIFAAIVPWTMILAFNAA